MNALFVTPSETGTGEAMTAGYVARDLLRHAHDVHFAASMTTARLLADMFPDRVTVFGQVDATNRSLWHQVVRRTRPDVIVFTDYPLLFMTSGTMPLASPAWAAELRDMRVPLATLDHLGFAQGPGVLYFGPPHLTMHAQSFAAVPNDMQILLPCPLFEGSVPGWRGTPVRYWNLPLTLSDEAREATRRQYLAPNERFLLVHSTPRWAIQMADVMRLPHYQMLPRILAHYLSDLPEQAVLVSVNDGALLPDSETPQLRIVNLPPMSADGFERLLLSANLVLSDNRVSASMSKAVCAGVPSVALINSFRLPEAAGSADPVVAAVVNDMERQRTGCIFPFDVFPIWSRKELDQLGVFQQPLYSAALVSAELFGGAATAERLVGLLTDPAAQQRLRRSQDAYVSALARIAGAVDVLAAA